MAEWETRIVKHLPKELKGSLPTVAEIEAEIDSSAREIREAAAEYRVAGRRTNRREMGDGLRTKRVTPEFVYCLARTYDFRENAIKSMVGSSGRQRVQESCLGESMVWVPAPSVLSLFGEIAQPLFGQTKVLRGQQQRLRTARDLLLPRLMSGGIEV